MSCYWPTPVKVRHLVELVPCGGCVGCLTDRTRSWAVRGMHEASLHLQNAFVTLTYGPEHLPPGGSLDRRAFPLFMKRLRKARDGADVRYLHAGEYGGRLGRPHYHAVLFGVGFPDKVPWTVRGEHEVYRSPELEELWPFGQSEIGSVTAASVAYVARYVLKKRTRKGTLACDQETGEVWPVEPEYSTMSRRPGLGRRFVERFAGELLATGTCRMDGREVPLPRYYERVLAELDPTGFEALCRKREREAVVRVGERSRERLAVKEAVTQARLGMLERSVE